MNNEDKIHINSFKLYDRDELEELTKQYYLENQQLKGSNLAMQEEMARTWAKLEKKEELEKENKKLKKEKKELIKFLKEEQNRLARECSPIYEDDFGKTRFVNEDIFNEISKILSKIEKSDK